MIDDILAKFEEDTAIVLESISLDRNQGTDYQWEASVGVYVNDETLQKALGERGNIFKSVARSRSARKAIQAALESLQKNLWEIAKRQELPPQPFGLAIKLNNAGVSEQCRICEQWFDMEVGPALFKEDSYEPVCLDCGRKYEPDLSKMLNAHYHAMSEIPF